jgi:hypothetical protein
MNHDEFVDRVLKGLRTAEPPPGMEQRILRAMESPATPTATWRVYAAIAVCVAMAAAWCIATIKVPPSAPRVHQSIANTAQTVAPVAAPAKLRRVRAVRHAHAESTQTASFPAPPLPLTDQEKLLLRLAHRRDADKEAALNPAIHAAQIAKANEQFQQFFNIDDKEMRKQIE